MGQFHWDPDGYLEMVRAEVPDYDRLPGRAGSRDGRHRRAAACLELGRVGRHVASASPQRHPHAQLTGVDERRMTRRGRTFPGPTALQDLGEPLPEGQFDLVFSALADPPPRRGRQRPTCSRAWPPCWRRAGRFVMADVIVPEDPGDVVTPLDAGFDLPETVPDLLRWLQDAGLRGRVAWQARDLAVLAAERAASGVAPTRPRQSRG